LFSNKETGDEEKLFQQRADNRDIERASGWAGAKELCRKHCISAATFLNGGPNMAGCGPVAV
jgi:hypothetical protein